MIRRSRGTGGLQRIWIFAAFALFTWSGTCLGLGGKAFTAAPPTDQLIQQFTPVADSPCNGTVSPDSYGNIDFTFTGDSSAHYEIEWSNDNGASWADVLHLGPTRAGDVKVSLNRLLILGQSSQWEWRAHWLAGADDYKDDHDPRLQSVYSNVCRFTIHPASTQMLPAPVLKAPACGSDVANGFVQFNLDNAQPGDFKDFKVELQYSAYNAWRSSNLVTEINKADANGENGAFVPVTTLQQLSGRWRWRARMYSEHIPLVSKFTKGLYSSWCEFHAGPQSLTIKANPMGVGGVNAGAMGHVSGLAPAPLNPQPLPPGMRTSLNPQPLPPGRTSLNPQPLPPGRLR